MTRVTDSARFQPICPDNILQLGKASFTASTSYFFPTPSIMFVYFSVWKGLNMCPGVGIRSSSPVSITCFYPKR